MCFKNIFYRLYLEEKEENEDEVAKTTVKKNKPLNNPQKIKHIERDISPKMSILNRSIKSDYNSKPFEQSLRKYTDSEISKKNEEKANQHFLHFRAIFISNCL